MTGVCSRFYLVGALLQFTASVSLAAAPELGRAGAYSGSRTVVAQAQPPGGTADNGSVIFRLNSNPTLLEWTKVCRKEAPATVEACYITRDFVSAEGRQTLAVALADANTGGDRATVKVLRLIVPPGYLLPQGVRFVVDSGTWSPARYQICNPQGCVAESVVDDAFVNQMTKGIGLAVGVLDTSGREIVFIAPLEGFGKAFSGPPIASDALREQQERFVKDAEGRSQAGGDNPVTPPAPKP